MKVLFVCESFSPKLSGGKVVRYLYKVLTQRGHDVRVVITSPCNEADIQMQGNNEFITVVPSRSRYYQRLYALVNPRYVPIEFQKLVCKFAPDVVHFASFDHTKSENLYRYCSERGIRIVLQPWTMHFYCAQGFGYRLGAQCTRCIDYGVTAAITEGCTSIRGTISQLERASMRRWAIADADMILSSNSSLDAILQLYGVAQQRIARFPIAFEAAQTSPLNHQAGDYFIYYGQANSHKGTDFIVDLFRVLPDKKLKLYPMTAYTPSEPLPSNIEVVLGVGWDNGLREAIEGAKAVVVPSLWATSTEYSLCEAMMMRKPVIVFTVGVHKDILTDRQDAMLVEVGNREQFKIALDALDSDPALAQQIADAGAARIIEINEPDRLHGLLMAAYGAA